MRSRLGYKPRVGSGRGLWGGGAGYEGKRDWSHAYREEKGEGGLVQGVYRSERRNRKDGKEKIYLIGCQ